MVSFVASFLVFLGAAAALGLARRPEGSEPGPCGSCPRGQLAGCGEAADPPQEVR